VITFEGGPAHDQMLAIRGAPVMLRVVIGPGGKLDALDQPGDVAGEKESIHVYRLASEVTWMFIRASKGMGGRWPMAEYKYYEPQPIELQVPIRDNKAWGDWCESVRASVIVQLHAEGLGAVVAKLQQKEARDV
jgi:hypothetical protein